MVTRSSSYILTPLAESDLFAIWDYIAADNPDAADRVIDEIEKKLLSLTHDPGMGHVREELAERCYLFFPVRSYLVVYERDSNPLRIIRILHGARDVANLV